MRQGVWPLHIVQRFDSGDAQVRDLDARFCATREAGVERVFWSPIYAGGQMDDCFRPMGLVTTERQRRLAFEHYRS